MCATKYILAIQALPARRRYLVNSSTFSLIYTVCPQNPKWSAAFSKAGIIFFVMQCRLNEDIFIIALGPQMKILKYINIVYKVRFIKKHKNCNYDFYLCFPDVLWDDKIGLI